jgi:hypothetical protein
MHFPPPFDREAVPETEDAAGEKRKRFGGALAPITDPHRSLKSLLCDCTGIPYSKKNKNLIRPVNRCGKLRVHRQREHEDTKHHNRSSLGL